MTVITITQLKKLTSAQLISKLPFEVTCNGTVICIVAAPTSRITTEDGDPLENIVR